MPWHMHTGENAPLHILAVHAQIIVLSYCNK